jgi:type VI secretion system secreted protein VgrG
VRKSVIALFSPDGIAMSTADRVMISAQKDVSVATGSRFSVHALKHVVMAATERISLFAQKLGVKIIAAWGPVQIQAQSDLLSLAADKDVTVSSVNGSVLVRAAREIIFECKGAYIKLANGCITLGAPRALYWEIEKFDKTKGAQMHLGAPAFAPQMFPFQVSCEAWRGGASLAREASPQVAAREGGELLPSAPASKQSTTETTRKTIPLIPVDSPDSPNADHDSAHEPRLASSSDLSVPIKLEKAVFCNWQMPSFVKECTDVTETGSYKEVDDLGNIVLRNGIQAFRGSTFPTAFELSYDENTKTLYATVRIKVVPVDLFKTNANGEKQSVPYETTRHHECVSNGVGKPSDGFVMEYREGTGPRFDAARKQREVEAVLNGHKSKLILDGCTKGASCGCRVSVFFKVELLMSIRGAEVGNGKYVHKTVHLFPRTDRADAGSWGEIGMMITPTQFIVDNPDDTNVVAHECGHLFNFPDEYWKNGGWVHNMYIKNSELDFSLGNANQGKEAWQISSSTNVMGGGATRAVSRSPYVGPSATVHPYYLEYIRRHFAKATHKNWKIGYGD